MSPWAFPSHLQSRLHHRPQAYPYIQPLEKQRSLSVGRPHSEPAALPQRVSGSTLPSDTSGSTLLLDMYTVYLRTEAAKVPAARKHVSQTGAGPPPIVLKWLEHGYSQLIRYVLSIPYYKSIAE